MTRKGTSYFVSGSEKDISFVASMNKRLYILGIGIPCTREYVLLLV